MSEERRYDEQEVAEILERATASEAALGASPSSARQGLTLTQIQEIGSDVGIAPARIAEAARGLGIRAEVGVQRKFLGAPRSVSRTVHIDRALTDDEWTRLVVDLRETFHAEGRVRVVGPLRSWSNGNLQIHVEPDGERYRVRMTTLKGDALPLAGMSASMLFVPAIVAALALTGSAPSESVVIGTMFGAGSLGLLGYIRIMLSRWSEERAAQMEGLAERIPALLDE